MSRALAVLSASVRELWSLLVDDGFLAVAALVAVGITYLLSRDGVLGPSDLTGWALIGMLATATVISLARAVRAATPREN